MGWALTLLGSEVWLRLVLQPSVRNSLFLQDSGDIDTLLSVRLSQGSLGGSVIKCAVCVAACVCVCVGVCLEVGPAGAHASVSSAGHLGLGLLHLIDFLHSWSHCRRCMCASI